MLSDLGVRKLPTPEMVKAHDMWRSVRDANFAPGEVPDIVGMRKRFEEFISQFPVVEGATTQDVDAGGVNAIWVAVPGADRDRVVLYLHGGGYCIGDPRSHRALSDHIASAAGARMLTVDYRLAPEHAHPAAVDDATSAYRWLLQQGTDPARVVIAGDSAGGGLTLATLLALRDAGDPLPAGAALLSPWTDVTCSGDSIATKADSDPILTSEGVQAMAVAYMMGGDPTSPLASPLFGDLAGLPPLLIHVGDCETLLDDSLRVAAKAKEAGVDVTLEVESDAPHVWHVFASFLPEGKAAIERIGAFVRARTDR